MPAVSAVIAWEAMPEAAAGHYAEDEQRWSSLMASAQAGNESDYRQLLGELSELVSRYLRTRLGGYDFVEDCVQDVLIAIHEARHTYDPRRPFRPWLFAIIRHKSTDAIRWSPPVTAPKRRWIAAGCWRSCRLICASR